MSDWHLIFQDDANGLRVFADEESFVFHHKNEKGRWRTTEADKVDWFLLTILLLEEKYNNHVCAMIPTERE